MKRFVLAVCFIFCTLGVFGQQRLVVPPFQDRKSGIDTSQMETLTDLFINAIQRTNRFDVPDRDALALLTQEANFQLSDWSDDTKTVEIGKVLSANYIVRVIVSEIDTNVYLLLARLLQLPSAKILDSTELEFTSVRDARARLDTFAKECLDNIKTTYKIGDVGPAGGIVFYDKGVFSGGWRYLEAAPAETEFSAEWGAYEKYVSGIGEGVGSGKRNTQIIVDYLKQIGETGKAAQLCATLDFDGFKDWFLPSKEELNLMYLNLKSKGLGNFQSDWYWSSSRYNDDNAWYRSFSTGGQDGDGKYRTHCVRAVRAF